MRRLGTALKFDLAWVRDQTRHGGLAASWQAGGRTENRLQSGGDIGLAKEWLARKPREMPEVSEVVREFARASEAAADARGRAEEVEAGRAPSWTRARAKADHRAVAHRRTAEYG